MNREGLYCLGGAAVVEEKVAVAGVAVGEEKAAAVGWLGSCVQYTR